MPTIKRAEEPLTLQTEIDRAARTISTDAYEMSVGEVMNMYKEGEIVINPEYQRLFRWDDVQKSKFIESLLLRIPIPPYLYLKRNRGSGSSLTGFKEYLPYLNLLDFSKIPREKR